MQPSPTTALRSCQQAVRITLKEIESLTFNMTNPLALKGLQSELKSVKAKYVDGLGITVGLILRPKLTQRVQTAHKFELTLNTVQVH